MDSACPKEHATEIFSDSDHLSKVESTTFNVDYTNTFASSFLTLATHI